MSGVLAAVVGGATGVVNISSGVAADDVEAAPSSALARIDVESDGDITVITSVGSVDYGDWITPKAAAPGAYEIMVHQDSGDAVTGVLDTWQALTSSRSWSLEQIVAGEKSASLTVSIRLGGVTLSTGTFTLHAQVL